MGLKEREREGWQGERTKPSLKSPSEKEKRVLEKKEGVSLCKTKNVRRKATNSAGFVP